MLTGWAERACLSGLERIHHGTLRVQTRGARHTFGRHGDLDASLAVHDPRLFRRALVGADIGIGESYMDGDWSSPDVVALARLLLRNRAVLERRVPVVGALTTLAAALARRFRDNSLAGSRRHIHRHYDLGNDFFALFLDTSLRMYSSAYFESDTDSLERAQAHKADRLCRWLDLQPGDRVLEIGSGWGGFAAWAAERYGCRVTTTTISEAQKRQVREWQARAGDAGARVEVLRADYRELTGRYDKIVSIEMFEAVGLRHYDAFFGAVDRLLAPHGAMAMQTITVSDQWFPRYQGTPDWIEKHIFPGGELASLGAILASLARATSLSLHTTESFGWHYARTLREWRARFHAQIDRVRDQGFDDRFIRMWDFYLAICEAAFLERHTSVYQLLLVKNGAPTRWFNDPPAAAAGRATAAPTFAPALTMAER